MGSLCPALMSTVRLTRLRAKRARVRFGGDSDLGTVGRAHGVLDEGDNMELCAVVGHILPLPAESVGKGPALNQDAGTSPRTSCPIPDLTKTIGAPPCSRSDPGPWSAQCPVNSLMCQRSITRYDAAAPRRTPVRIDQALATS